MNTVAGSIFAITSGVPLEHLVRHIVGDAAAAAVVLGERGGEPAVADLCSVEPDLVEAQSADLYLRLLHSFTFFA